MKLADLFEGPQKHPLRRAAFVIADVLPWKFQRHGEGFMASSGDGVHLRLEFLNDRPIATMEYPKQHLDPKRYDQGKKLEDKVDRALGDAGLTKTKVVGGGDGYDFSTWELN